MSALLFCLAAIILPTYILANYEPELVCNTTNKYWVPWFRYEARRIYNTERGSLEYNFRMKNADGKQVPKAKEMKNLNYSCSLEEEAQKYTEEACKTGKFDESFDGNHWQADNWPKDDPIPFLTGTAVRYWLKSGAAKLHTTDSDTFIYTEDMKPSESFVRVANGELKEFGCFLNMYCGEKRTSYFACKYSPSTVQFGGRIYEVNVTSS